MDRTKSSAPAHPSTEERPYICYEGLVFIGHLETTEEGEEIEVVTPVPVGAAGRPRTPSGPTPITHVYTSEGPTIGPR